MNIVELSQKFSSLLNRLETLSVQEKFTEYYNQWLWDFWYCHFNRENHSLPAYTVDCAILEFDESGNLLPVKIDGLVFVSKDPVRSRISACAGLQELYKTCEKNGYIFIEDALNRDLCSVRILFPNLSVCFAESLEGAFEYNFFSLYGLANPSEQIVNLIKERQFFEKHVDPEFLKGFRLEHPFYGAPSDLIINSPSYCAFELGTIAHEAIEATNTNTFHLN